MAAKANLVIDQGSKFSITVTVTDVNGDILNLDNHTAATQFRKSYTTSTFYTIPSTISNPTAGEISLEMSSANTNIVPAGRYVYDVEVYNTNDANNATRVLEGLITVTPGVTRGN